MAKLFPPYIEGTLPAFYQSNGTTKMVVPFVMNRGVRFGEIKGLMMKIKSIQSNTYLYSAKNDEEMYTENSAVFTLPPPINTTKKIELTTTIENAKVQLENIQTKKTLLEKISSYFEKLKELENQQESIDIRESNKKFYENRIAEISNYYLQNREDYATLTMEEKIKLLEKVKTQKIIDLGKNGAYYDIQNVNIAKNFFNIVKNLDSEIVELQSTNSEIVTNQILETIEELVDDNYLSFVNRDLNDYSDFNNLQNILFLEDNSDVIRINNKIIEQEKIITDTTTELESFTSEDLKPGLFYKIQLAYINQDDEIGQYSTIGVIKYTTMPDVTIEGMSTASINTTWHEFKGIYHQDPDNGDTSEHVYSYQFDFYDVDHNLIDSSGTLLHNSTTDPNGYQSYDTYYFSKTLGVEEVYYVQYTVTTQNGLVVSSPEYAVMEKFSVNLDLPANLIAELNYDNGYIKVVLEGIPSNGVIPDASGHYILARANSGTDFSVWEKILTFSLLNEKPNKLLWRDYTIEQGKTYKYSIQQYNDNGVYSSRRETEKIFADFEDMFLSDGKRQLKIRFNPKVSTFKNDILEQKVDTIGSKYPFFFRNGNVYYKEFQISGLISRLMDEEELFFNWDVPDMSCRHDAIWTSKGSSSIYGYHETKSELIPIEQQMKTSSGREIDKTINLKTNITSDNIYNERQFKLEVLKWLNNGEPKIFRSPAEGNYIVRLMNVSLSPEDKLSRMLHNFQCTAYEVDDFTYNNLNKNNFLQNTNQSDKVLMYKTIQFYEDNEDGTRIFKSGTIINDEIIGLWIYDCQPGEKFKIITSDSQEQRIVIGSTGQYIIEYPTAIQSFSIEEGTLSSGQITYSYYAKPVNDFDDLEKVDIIDIYCKQIINKHEPIFNIFDELLKSKWNGNYYESKKVSLNKIYYIKIQSWLDEETYFNQLDINTNTSQTNNSQEFYSKQGFSFHPNEELYHDRLIHINNQSNCDYIKTIKIQVPFGEERITSLKFVHCGKNLFDFKTIMEQNGIPKQQEPDNSIYWYRTNSSVMKNKFGETALGFYNNILNWNTQITCSISYRAFNPNNLIGGLIIKTNNTLIRGVIGPYIDPTNNTYCHNSTPEGNIKYIYFDYLRNLSLFLENIQLEVGSNTTGFEEYNGQTYEIDLSNIEFYGGEIDLLNGKIISNYDNEGNLLITPNIIDIDSKDIQINKGINNFFVYGDNGRSNIEISYIINKDFISVRDKTYFIPINKINTKEDLENMKTLYLYPQTELEIGYQIINRTFINEIQRINPQSNKTYYQEYQEALNAFNDYINDNEQKLWTPFPDENNSYLEPSNYTNWENEGSNTNIEIAKENNLLEEIQQTKNNYDIDVIRYRNEVEKERRENDNIENDLIATQNGGVTNESTLFTGL